MSHPRLDTEQLSPEFDGNDDEDDGGVLDRFDFICWLRLVSDHTPSTLVTAPPATDR